MAPNDNPGWILNIGPCVIFLEGPDQETNRPILVCRRVNCRNPIIDNF